MLYALIFILTFIAIGAVVVLVGRSLPKRHRVTVAARYKQPADAVFEAISNWRDLPNWRRELKFVRERKGADGRTSWSEFSRHGELPLEVLESSPPTRMVAQIVGEKLPFGGIWTWEIQPDAGGGCTLAITEDGEVYNPIFRFMARFFFGYESTLRGYHESLSRKFGQACEFVKV